MRRCREREEDGCPIKKSTDNIREKHESSPIGLLDDRWQRRKSKCVANLQGRNSHSKNRLVETTKKLVDMCLTKLLVKITNPSFVNYKCLTNHIG